MAIFDANNRLKRLQNQYRLIVMNEDTFEEVVKFKLSRLSVYIFMSTVFVLMIVLTTSLIVFTPLKYYLPGAGFGSAKQMREYRNLKIRTDSMEMTLQYQQRYLENIQKVLKGTVVKIDTNNLKLPAVENIDD